MMNEEELEFDTSNKEIIEETKEVIIEANTFDVVGKTKVGIYGEIDNDKLHTISKFYLEDFKDRDDKIGKVIKSNLFKLLLCFFMQMNGLLWMDVIGIIVYDKHVAFTLFQKIVYVFFVVLWPPINLYFLVWFCIYRYLRYKLGIELDFFGLKY